MTETAYKKTKSANTDMVLCLKKKVLRKKKSIIDMLKKQPVA